MTETAGGPADDSFPVNEETFQEFFDGPRDEFMCESCGSKAYRGHRGGEPGAFYAEVDGEPTVVCHDCNDKYGWGTIEARIRARRFGFRRSPVWTFITPIESAIRSVTSRIPVALSVSELPPERRRTLRAEQTVFIGRLTLALALTTVILSGVALIAGIAGVLFISPMVGVEWFVTVLALSWRAVLHLSANPAHLLGLLGLGYLIHLAEFQRHLDPPDRSQGRGRPRWQSLAMAATGGGLGWLLWVLGQHGLLSRWTLPVGVVTWSASTVALVYLLHGTLAEDRWSYGLQVRPVRWKFPAQFALGLMIYHGVFGLPGPPGVGQAVALAPPLSGGLYATRRYLVFTDHWARLRHRLRPVTRHWRQFRSALPAAPAVSAGRPPVESQFTQVSTQESGDTQTGETGPAAGGRDAKLEQAREWATYLEEELQDREDQLRMLEGELAQVQQELEADESGASESDDDGARDRDELVADLFEIRDNFGRALEAAVPLEDDAADALREGVGLIDRQIAAMLEREGIEEVETSGSVDPRKHRVVETRPSPGHDPGEIVEVYRRGYRHGDRVLREADVVVAADGDSADRDGARADGGRVATRPGAPWGGCQSNQKESP